MSAEILYHQLFFKRPSGTSRGILKTKDSWYLYKSVKDELLAIGEVSLIDKLSIDPLSEIEQAMFAFANGTPFDKSKFPAVSFAQDIFTLSQNSTKKDPFHLFDSPFVKGKSGIPINGLIWMGEKNFMFEQIKQKIDDGFRCLKLKIGAIDFTEEQELLTYVRKHFSADDLELRVDANGAFELDSVKEKLQKLATFDIHSIEQPIKQGNWEAMAALCADTPLPIALDEELIGITSLHERKALLQTIRPQYIILKPSLIGGFQVADQWITLAEKMNIGWWATSALEGNVGLNAIAQWVAAKDTSMPQGLGTGMLYTNNIDSPLQIKNAQLWYDTSTPWDLSLFE